MIASIGNATINNPAIANPISIMGRSSKQKKNLDIPQQALMPNIIILKNTYIIAIAKSMIIASTSLSRALLLYMILLFLLALLYSSIEKRKRSIMIGLKKLAVEMDCPVIVISKLPEPVNLYDNKRPEITDLDSSDYSTQYSDVIVFMHQDRSLLGKISDKEILTDLIIAKNRSGKDGVVKLRQQFEYSRFVNYI